MFFTGGCGWFFFGNEQRWTLIKVFLLLFFLLLIEAICRVTSDFALVLGDVGVGHYVPLI